MTRELVSDVRYHGSQRLTGYKAYTVSVIFLSVAADTGPKDFFSRETHCWIPAKIICTIMAYRLAGTARPQTGLTSPFALLSLWTPGKGTKFSSWTLPSVDCFEFAEFTWGIFTPQKTLPWNLSSWVKLNYASKITFGEPYWARATQGPIICWHHHHNSNCKTGQGSQP